MSDVIDTLGVGLGTMTETRGRAIARRMKALGLNASALESYSEKIGRKVDRNLIARAMRDESHDSSYLRVEDALDRYSEEVGADRDDGDEITFEVTGPKTEWHVKVHGPFARADEIREQVARLLQEVEDRADG